MKECVVCSKVNSVYKCPQCSSLYCSVTCCRSHKLECGSTSATHSVNESCTSLVANVITAIDSAQAGTKPIGAINYVNNDPLFVVDGDSSLLTDTQKQRLLASAELKTLLKSKRLRQHIDLIDLGGDSNNNDNSNSTSRQKMLKTMRGKDVHFESFVGLLLKVISQPSEADSSQSNSSSNM